MMSFRSLLTRHTLPLAALSATLLAGCGSSSSESATTASDATDGSDATGGGANDVTDDASGGPDDMPTDAGADTTSSCTPQSPVARGFVQTSRGIVFYHNTPVTVSASRDQAKGCVNSLDLGLAIDGGCALSLRYTSFKNSWKLESATFTEDGKCGEAWLDVESSTFTADTSTAHTSLMGVEAPAPTTDDACPKHTMSPIGYFTLTAPAASSQEDRAMEIDLNDLKIEGDFEVADSTASGCPVEARTCLDLECGADYFGVECGDCTNGLTCSSGVCVESGCEPDTDNKAEGGPIGDQIYKDGSGADWNLHSQCGAPAVWMIKVAHWCSACAALAPSFQALYDQYAPLGVTFVLLVGENLTGGPAKVADAASYKVKHGYQAGWVTLQDPHWELTEVIVESTSDYIPSHVILDQDLILRQSSANSDSVWAEEIALLQILKRQGLVD
jgi:hypothetical protein